MKSKFLVLDGVSQRGFSLGGKDSPAALFGWFLTLSPGEGGWEKPSYPRGQEEFVQCINKEIVWLQRALEAEAALKSG